jgi:hypothetical protein
MTTPASHPELDPLCVRAVLREHRFESTAPVVGPLIAWLRERWNSIATKWYVRPLIQQQSEFNLLVAERLANQETRLVEQAAHLDRLGRLAEAHEARLVTLELSRNELLIRSGEHDAWLVDQDHDQVDLTRSQAEISARTVQIERLLAEFDRRLAGFEADRSPRSEPS